MHLATKLLLATLLSITSALPVLAEKRAVTAGKSNVLTFWYAANRLCEYGGKPNYRLSTKPEHGTVSARWIAYKMGAEARNCRGKYMKGMLVTYTPDKGYRGPDKLRFSFSGSGGPGAAYSAGESFSFDLEVR